MQSGLPAVTASGGEKTAQSQRYSGTGFLQPAGCRSDGYRLDVAFDLSRVAGFDLFRVVGDQAFDDRYPGRSEAQRFAFDQRTGQLDAIFGAIQPTLAIQAAASPAGASAGAGSRASSIDFDFSSFIIGDGVVTARLVRMIR